MNNGLRTFALHSGLQHETVALLRPQMSTAPTRGDGQADLATLDPETVARHCLRNALASDALPAFAADEVNGEQGEFRSLGVTTIPFTQTRTVKFRQFYHKIPVYGSLVTVELDMANELVSINSALGTPANVDPIATVSPARALQTAGRHAGYAPQQVNGDPRLHFYYDAQASRWRLVYIIEDVQKQRSGSRRGRSDSSHDLPEFVDYVVDAHTGTLVAELPRTQTMAGAGPGAGSLENAVDALGATRQIGVSNSGSNGGRRLHNATYNIHTHDFGFRDARFLNFLLPGPYVENPPAPWQPGSVSAHANSEEVAAFLTDVLMRNGLDNLGGPIISSVNCLWSGHSNGKEWRNAARLPGQMIYGQRLVNGVLLSYAASKDVVAHELLHGLTDHSARLEYRFESGALNESYSDIFGIIVSNLGEPDLGRWNWQMGEDLSATGLPLRDLRDPTVRGQPAHMDDYRVLPASDDHGGVHTNSGIHNKAAYNLLTATDAAGHYLFDAVTVARLFYLALTQHLSRTSRFVDSRRGVLTSAMTLLRDDPRRNEKLAAIVAAFDAVGITDEGG